MVEMLKLMLGRDSEDEIDQDLCLNLRYELNPRVRCAFGNVCLIGLLLIWPAPVADLRILGLSLEQRCQTQARQPS